MTDAPPPFAFVGLPEVAWYECPGCGRNHPSASASITRDDKPYAWYLCFGDAPANDVRVFVAFVGAGRGAAREAAVFATRFGAVDGQEGPAYSLIDMLDDVAPIKARPLTREAALVHPRQQELWDLVDWLYFVDPVMHQVTHHNVLPTALEQMQPGHDIPGGWIGRLKARRLAAKREPWM